MRRRTRQLQSFALRQMQFQLPLSAFTALGSRCNNCTPSLARFDAPTMLMCLYLLR